MRVLLGRGEPTRSLAFAPDGKALASGGANGSVRLWDVAAGSSVELARATGPVHAVAFTRERGDVAWTAAGGVVVWSPDPPRWVVRSAPGPSNPSSALTRLSVHPDGRTAVVTSNIFYRGRQRGGWAACLDLYTGQALHDGWGRLPEVPRLVMTRDAYSVTFAPDGTALAASTGGLVLLIDWPAATLRCSLERGSRNVAFSPDGRRLAGGPLTRDVLLWDVPPAGRPRDQSRPRVLHGHTRQAKALAFSPDGATLATGGLDRTVVLWDVADGRSRVRYDWEVGAVHALAFAPDGMTLAVGGEKGIVLCDME